MPESHAASPRPARLVSLDALRGFDMFWILGSDGLARALHAFGPVQPAAALKGQLEHAKWQGFHFEDLIFPTFVFIAGVSLVLALTRVLERDGRARTTRRVVVRALLIFAVGLLYYGGLRDGIDEIRWGGVLQRIALSYLGAGLLFVWLKPRGLAVAFAGLLAGYAALLTCAPIYEEDGETRAAESQRFVEGINVADAFDRLHLPGRKYNVDHDPEGLLSNIPAVASCLLGVGAGLLLKREISGSRKVLTLAAAGAVLLLAGWAWSPWMPVIKRIWTPTYVLVAGGCSVLLLAGFYWIIDVRGHAHWARPFVWIGMNPITLYLLCSFIDFTKLASRLTGGEVMWFLNDNIHEGTGQMLNACVGLGFCILIARWLYHRGIFLRL